MKNFGINILTVLTLVTTITFSTLAQSNESRKVSGFRYLVSGVTCNVHVKIDGTESVSISASPDVSKLIKTVVENDTLKINYVDNIADGQGNSESPIDIYVTAKTLSSLAKNGAGLIEVDGALTGNNVNIVLNGSGNILSNVNAKELKIILNSAGCIYVGGTAENADVNVNGSGKVSGNDLKTKNATLSLNLAGSIYLHADNTISAQIAGSGRVIYTGDAIVTNSKTEGSGSISKAN